MTTYRIKPLEWNATPHKELIEATTPFGRYEILDYFDGNYTAFFYYGGSSYGPIYHLLKNKGNTLDYAKAVCNDHWERLMKQALEEVCTTQHQ